MTSVILPEGGALHQRFSQAIAQRQVVLFAGLPGVGKSLYLQQLALMASQAGKQVHLLQWDVTRQAFELPEVLARYPELDGVTHAGIRKMVGMWARDAIADWAASHDAHQHILIGEVPLIGNRLVEVVQPQGDAAEALLTSDACLVIVPVPSRRIRERIEQARAATIRNPQHARERADAPSHVLSALWQQLHQLALQLGISQDADTRYNPEVYAAVYAYLLQHRHHVIMPVDDALTPQGSVYDVDGIASELRASLEQVSALLHRLESLYNPEQLEHAVAHWYALESNS